MKRLIWVRHPQTKLNHPPVRIRGGVNVPLSPEGLAQIPTIVSGLQVVYPDIRKIYTSPLDRASILANTLAHEYGIKATELPGLSSRDYGIYNGREVSEVLPVLTLLSTGEGRDLAPKHGISMNDFIEALAAAIRQIISEAPEEGHTLICSHLQNIMLGRRYLEQGLPENIKDLQYEYKETDEIPPGGWVEMRREWIVTTH